MNPFVQISTMMIFLIVLLFLYANIASSVNLTSQYGDFTIQWEEFSILTCAQPKNIAISTFNCITNKQIELNELSCLEEIIVDFQETTCQYTGATQTLVNVTRSNTVSLTTTQATNTLHPTVITVNNSTSSLVKTEGTSTADPLTSLNGFTSTSTSSVSRLTSTLMTDGNIFTTTLTIGTYGITSTIISKTNEFTNILMSSTNQIISTLSSNANHVTSTTSTISNSFTATPIPSTNGFTSTLTTFTSGISPILINTVSGITIDELITSRASQTLTSTMNSITSTQISSEIITRSTSTITISASTIESITTEFTSSVMQVTTVHVVYRNSGNPYYCPGDSIGTNCNMAADICTMSQPCQNDASCYSNRSLPLGYRCECQTGYVGINCEDDRRICTEKTCWNNGTCSVKNLTNPNTENEQFNCTCMDGYTGIHCELKVDLCQNITCYYNGQCKTNGKNWTCICLDPTLYYGEYCQYKTSALQARIVVSKSFGSVAITVVILTCSFVIAMDIIKYVFHIDVGRSQYHQNEKSPKEKKRPPDAAKVAIRFQYVA